MTAVRTVGQRLSILVLLLALTGCDPRDPAPEVIRIGVLVNLAGSEGRSTRAAASLALSALADAGELDVGGHRRRVELLVEDTGAAPDTAIEGARRLIQQGAVAIVGPSRSRDAIAAGEVAENARVPLISPSSTHPLTTEGKRYVFRVASTDTLLGHALGRFAAGELGAGTAAVLYDVASAYNRNLATVFRQAFEAAGGEVVAFETYTTGEEDLNRPLERIRDARPQVLLLPNYSEEVPVQARLARYLGIEATLVGGDAWSAIPFASEPALEGAFFLVHWHVDEARPQAERFLARYRQVHGADPTDNAALTYDAFGLLFQALGAAGDDPDEIRQALAATVDYQGVTGTITYRGAGGDPAKRLVIARVQDGGYALFRVIEPAALQSPAVRTSSE